MNHSSSTLSTVAGVLDARFQQALGKKPGKRTEAGTDSPSWHLVRASDLRSPAEPGTPAAGVLIDPEIGLVLFFVPFQSGDKLESQVQAALDLQANLDGTKTASSSSPDLRSLSPGSLWQVALHWLVEDSRRADWAKQVALARQHSRFSEQLAVDVTFYAANQLESALEAHGLPRLLLTARYVLGKGTPADIADWMSADRGVIDELEDFPLIFADAEERRRAQMISDHLGELVLAAKAKRPAAGNPKTLEKLEVRDLRNLSKVRLDFGSGPVSCRVIQGPNGTGKTSLFEALSLALSGSSARYRNFLNRDEKEVTGKDRRRTYTEDYLTPMGRTDVQPGVGLNGQAPTCPSLVDSWETASRAENELNGTLLAQETSCEFANMSADQLALWVLAGYSELSERLETFVQEKVSEASLARQDFLRSLGLLTTITRHESAAERIVDQALAKDLPQAASALVAWLAKVMLHPAGAADCGSLLADWQQCSDAASRKTLAGKLTSGDEAATAATLQERLETFKALNARTRKLLDRCASRLAPFGEHLDDALRDLTAWGEWLGRKGSKKETASSSSRGKERSAVQTDPLFAKPDNQGLRRQIDETQAAQQKITQAGQAAKQHLEHLDQVVTFLAGGWNTRQPNQCPTCGVDHAAQGGIEKVVTELRASIAKTREQLKADYLSLNNKLTALRGSLPEKDDAACPLSEERQATLRKALAWLSDGGQPPLEAQLADPAQRSRLLSYLQTLQNTPALAEAVDTQRESQRLAQLLCARIEDARNIFLDPERWKPVQAAFVKKLTKVMAEHLPGTLQRLWTELTLNLTAAPWLLPERPGFNVVTKNKARRVSVALDERLARYVFNQAETHLLGLAWFFVRYFTHGRFRCRFLVMDDPVSHLDESGFRAFCRLCGTLLKLHTARGIPFRVLLFLHQEDRALAAAAATCGELDCLGWLPEQQGELLRLSQPAPAGPLRDPWAWFRDTKAAA